MTDAAPGRVRILIVDDHAVVRKGLAMVLRLEAEFEVVGEAGDGRTALHKAAELHPDLVLMDLVMPGMDGKEAAAALRQQQPGIRILMLSGAELDERLLDLIAAGVDGYVLKDIEPEDLRQAIRLVAHGEAYLHPAVARRVLNRLSSPGAQASAQQPAGSSPAGVQIIAAITPREVEILRWMATPASYREIASALVISEETVRTHAKRILNKLNQPNRVQAVLYAVRAGIIELPD